MVVLCGQRPQWDGTLFGFVLRLPQDGMKQTVKRQTKKQTSKGEPQEASWTCPLSLPPPPCAVSAVVWVGRLWRSIIRRPTTLHYTTLHYTTPHHTTPHHTTPHHTTPHHSTPHTPNDTPDPLPPVGEMHILSRCPLSPLPIHPHPICVRTARHAPLLTLTTSLLILTTLLLTLTTPSLTLLT